MERKFEPIIESNNYLCGYRSKIFTDIKQKQPFPLCCFGTVCTLNYSSKNANTLGIGVLIGPFHILTSTDNLREYFNDEN